MAKLTLSSFSGIAPKVPPRYLGDNQAQIAQNCVTWKGPLTAINGTESVYDLPKVGNMLTIYRFGQDIDTEDQYWFHWGQDVDVAKGFIAGDTSERTFYTGVSVPKATDATLALQGGGAEYPINSYQLGLPLPINAPTATIAGSAEDGAATEARVYTYTFVNSWGEESAPFAQDPMPPSTQIDVRTGQTVDLTIPVPPTGNWNITSKRIYRSVAGTGITTYLFVEEISAAQTVYNDSKTGEDLNEELPSLTWEPPPPSLRGLTGLAGGVLAGFTGNDVYLSEPYRPFAWPIQYQQSVGYKVIGLGAIDTTLVVLTQGKPFFLQGAYPDSMVLVEADISQACVSKRSIVSLNGMVYYASPDGLVALAPGGSRVVTQDKFDKALWSSIKPETIHAYAYEDQYIAFYDNGTTQGGFIYNTTDNSFSYNNVYATGGYSDLKNDTLYLAIDGFIHKWSTGAPLTYTWRSKKFSLPQEVAFSCFRVDAEAYPIEVDIYKDGVLFHNQTVTGETINRLPPGRGHDWEVELSGTGQVYRVTIAQAPQELAS